MNNKTYVIIIVGILLVFEFLLFSPQVPELLGYKQTCFINRKGYDDFGLNDCIKFCNDFGGDYHVQGIGNRSSVDCQLNTLNEIEK